ncbi:MAG: methyltransferase domain-containing protein [Chloroflexi bacterium]|nr:methyltransferase domain-containing protein [Chloroflexota bacterium]
MADNAKSLVQQQFGAHAAGYVTSTAHAEGYSLTRLIEIVDPQPGWRALDLATGGGHTALALARQSAWTVAGDLTRPMLNAARKHISAQPGISATYAQLDAEALPFPAGSFDVVTCRIAPHHFPHVAQFVRECARVVRPGGIVAVLDQLSPPDPKTARYVNAFERLRDPSHVWAYNEIEWQGFFTGAGLDIFHYEAFDTHHELITWAERMGNDAATITRLRVMLQQAPASAAAWMQPQPLGAADKRFVIRQFLLAGRKG